MDWISAIGRRTSRRSYVSAPTLEEMETLQQAIDQANQDSGLAITLMPDGSEAFSAGKSYGMFRGVQTLMVLKGPKHLLHLKEKVGWYGEKLILIATAMGLGTCWVGGTFDKSKLETPPEEEIICVVPVGHAAPHPSLKEKMIRGIIHRKTKSIREMVQRNRSLTPEEVQAMRLVQLAPTARNTQKVIFIFLRDSVSASVPGTGSFDLVDLGICKLHYALGMNQGTFAPGNGGVYGVTESELVL